MSSSEIQYEGASFRRIITIFLFFRWYFVAYVSHNFIVNEYRLVVMLFSIIDSKYMLYCSFYRNRPYKQNGQRWREPLLSFTLLSLSTLFTVLYSFAFLLVTFLIVIPLTSRGSIPAWEEPAPYSRTKLAWQLAFVFAILLIVLIMGYQDLHGGVPLLEGLLYFPLAVIIPLVGMRLLGASWRELGIGRGYHTWRVTIALLVVPILLMALGITIRKLSPIDFLTAPLSTLMSAGLPEEIIYRGVLMTRLVRIYSVQWGIVLSSLIFGLLHTMVNPGYFHTDLLASMALGITSQATAGIMLALVFQRTRSLIAGMA